MATDTACATKESDDVLNKLETVLQGACKSLLFTGSKEEDEVMTPIAVCVSSLQKLVTRGCGVRFSIQVVVQSEQLRLCHSRSI